MYNRQTKSAQDARIDLVFVLLEADDRGDEATAALAHMLLQPTPREILRATWERIMLRIRINRAKRGNS